MIDGHASFTVAWCQSVQGSRAQRPRPKHLLLTTRHSRVHAGYLLAASD